MKKWLFKGGIFSSAVVMIVCLILFNYTRVSAVYPPDVTEEMIASAIQGGQKYLFDKFHDNGDGTGYFEYGVSGGYDSHVATTGTAIAALLETGAYSNPAYAAIIDKAIAFLKTQVKADGSIHSGHVIYETGIAITALGLYGQATTQDAAYRTIVQNAVNFLINAQNADPAYPTVKGHSSYLQISR